MADDNALRAARLSRIPGVTVAEAAKRFRVTAAAVRRARLEVPGFRLEDLALSCLTRDGRVRKGTLGDLSGIAGYIDYVNHDGCTPAGVRRLLRASVRAGVLAIGDACVVSMN